MSEAFKASGSGFPPMDDPDWNPKSTTISRPDLPAESMSSAEDRSKTRWAFGVTGFIFLGMAFGAGYLFREVLPSWSREPVATTPEVIEADEPEPPFGDFTDDVLSVGASGQTGYLLTSGRLYRLNGANVTEISPATQPASR
jgi:hypothetical protein